VAFIVEERRQDDGAETVAEFGIDVWLPDGWQRVWVPSGNFEKMDWVIPEIGPSAIIYPRQSSIVRAAIQELSVRLHHGMIPRTTVFTHLGWLDLPGAERVFLHAAGALGTNGPVDQIDVALPGDLSRYELPSLTDEDDLRVDIRASLGLLDLAPDRIMVPLLAGVYRAPLGDVNLSLFLVGRTGVFKSELAAVCQQHYGRGLDASHLPANWSSTANSLEELAFAAKDVLLVVDDFVPQGSQREVGEYHGKAERLFRAVANHSGRQRMTADATLRPPRPPRGLVLATGEDLPRGHSLRSRIVAVEVRPEDVDLERLTQAQSDAAAGLNSRAMAGFVRWLAPRRVDAEKVLADINSLRPDFQREGSHGRTADQAVQLFWSWTMFLQYAFEAGAITEIEHDELLFRGYDALQGLVGSQVELHTEANVVDQFVELLSGAITSGHAHLAGFDGSAPPGNERALGWRDEGPDGEYRAKGDRVGWFDGTHLYLLPAVAMKAAEGVAGRSGESLVVSQQTLGKRMAERGILLSREASRETLKVRKMLEGRRQPVWDVDPIVFGVGGDPDDTAVQTLTVDKSGVVP
jgi:hypothetical protein